MLTFTIPSCDKECKDHLTLAAGVFSLFVINILFVYVTCAPKRKRELTPIEIVTSRMNVLEEQIIDLMAHRIVHTDILGELTNTREMLADQRREFRQKIALLTEGFEYVDTDKFQPWVKILKSKMNIL